MQSIYALSLSHLNEIGLGFRTGEKLSGSMHLLKMVVWAKVFVAVLT